MRTFERIDKLITPHWQVLLRLRGSYIDIALLYETPRRLCALASRLSHESHDRSTPETDAALLSRLEEQGEEHAKSLRGHLYYLAIEAPRYWWQETDTYTVGMIPMGSTSTMFKEAKKLKGEELVAVKSALPEGTLQLRIRAFSEQTLKRMATQRAKHRLPEWREFNEFVGQVIKL